MPSLEDELLSGLEPGPVRMNVGGVDGMVKAPLALKLPSQFLFVPKKVQHS